MRLRLSPAVLLNGLLICAPIAWFVEHTHGAPIAVFTLSAVAIIPLAGIMGRATEQLAERLGEGIGGLLNATFGNAAELIIALVAVRAGYYDLVKASLTGSIIGNILLVFGLSALLGGLRFQTQRFNRTAASLGVTTLVLSTIALVIPALFHAIVPNAPTREHTLSLAISVVLVGTYMLGLVFTLKTHEHLYTGSAGEHAPEVTGGATSTTGKALGLLLAATVGIAIMSELLVGAASAAAEALGMSQIFVGVILVAIVGNAAEHSSAILLARKDRMDAAISIAVGSSTQIALFVAPVLVFASYLIGPGPLDLVFTTFEVVAVVIAVAIMGFISQDGESNWMEGVQLLAVYLILGTLFYFLPE
jgi:Ca2+:H+ antiporter